MALSFSPRVRKSLRWVFAALTAAGLVLYLLATYDFLALVEEFFDSTLPPSESAAAALWDHARKLTLQMPECLLGACLALAGLPVWLGARQRWIGALIVIAGCTVASWGFLQDSVTEILGHLDPFMWLRNEWRNIQGLLFVGREYSTFIWVYMPRLLLIPWLFVLVRDSLKREPPSERDAGEVPP